MEDLLYFNGIDASTGSYMLPPIDSKVFARLIEGQNLDPKEAIELKNWYYSKTRAHLGLKEGDVKDLAQAGWGVIFPASGDPTIRQALKELIDWRQEQATRRSANYFHEFSGEEGYKPGETKLGWLARHGMGPGPAEPAKVPYYLLIVGDPATIPYRFQVQLDVQYGTGRVFFDTPDEYAAYAHSVVEAEKRQLGRKRQITFFGVSNPDDPATNLSAAELVRPLAEDTARDHPDWQVTVTPPVEATKNNLSALLGGDETPALLFTASHGMGFPNGHPLQYRRQGALLTQDWPGPKQFTQPVPEDFYFSADDLGDQAHVFGLLAFFFACYGAGTPQNDEFAQAAFKDTRATLAPQAFLAALPRRLLAHPHGSALAVVGHVDRAWGYSFMWGSAKRQLAVFESALALLLQGYPVGAALDPFNIRYAELSSELNSLLEDIQFGKTYEPRELAGLWTANNDARNYILVGDPAVRLMAALPGITTAQDEEVSQPVKLEAAPGADIGRTSNLPAGDVLLPHYSPGRLYSVGLDKSMGLPPLAEVILGRRDPATGHYPDIDLSGQGETGASVSRSHAKITNQAGELFIEDLDSRNRTFLNGLQLQPNQRYPLKHGDELRLGSVELIYLAT
jgi:hypothetical protein